MTIKHVLTLAAAPLALMATPADAALFTFTLSDGYNASFDIDQTQLTDVEETGFGFLIENIAGTFEGTRAIADSIEFATASNSGGFTFQLGDEFFGFFGPQLFTGSSTAPTLRTGTFALKYDLNGSAVTLNVAAVPEPATWAMMIAGFSAVGLAARRARRARRAQPATA